MFHHPIFNAKHIISPIVVLVSLLTAPLWLSAQIVSENFLKPEQSRMAINLADYADRGWQCIAYFNNSTEFPYMLKVKGMSADRYATKIKRWNYTILLLKNQSNEYRLKRTTRLPSGKIHKKVTIPIDTRQGEAIYNLFATGIRNRRHTLQYDCDDGTRYYYCFLENDGTTQSAYSSCPEVATGEELRWATRLFKKLDTIVSNKAYYDSSYCQQLNNCVAQWETFARRYASLPVPDWMDFGYFDNYDYENTTSWNSSKTSHNDTTCTLVFYYGLIHINFLTLENGNSIYHYCLNDHFADYDRAISQTDDSYTITYTQDDKKITFVFTTHVSYTRIRHITLTVNGTLTELEQKLFRQPIEFRTSTSGVLWNSREEE